MQDINPNAQTYQQAGTTPGSTTGPNDGQDYVQASTVNTGFRQISNTLAYLAGLVLGPGKAPPTAQPPELEVAFAGSGVARAQMADACIPSDLVYIYAGDGDIAEVPGFPQFQFVSPLGVPVWQTGHSYSTRNRVYSPTSGLQYQLIGSGGAAGAGPLTGTGQVSDGALTWQSLTGAGNLISNINMGAGPHAADVDVVYGQYCTNGGNTYFCSQAGHTDPANTPPTGTGQNQTDGTAKWSYVLHVGQWVMQGNAAWFGRPSGPALLDADGNVPVNAFETSGSGTSWTNSTSTFTTVTNLSTTFVCNGNPLVLKVVADGTDGFPAETSQWEIVSSSGGAEAFFRILMDGTTVIWAGRAGVQFNSAINLSVFRAAPNAVDYVQIDSPPSGSHTFAVQAAKNGVDATSIRAINLKFVGWNL